MKTVPYDGCTITYSIDTKDSWESENAKYFLDISGKDEIISIHSAVAANGGFSNSVLKGIISFCKSIGDKPVIYQFGAVTDEEVNQLKDNIKENPSEKYKHIKYVKDLSAILEYAGFVSVTAYSGCDYSEIYVFNNKEGRDLAYLMMMYSAGALVSSEADSETDPEIEAFVRAFGNDDARKSRVALALAKSLSGRNAKFNVVDKIRDDIFANKHTQSVKGF